MIGAVMKDLKENLFFLFVCFLLQSTGNHWDNSTRHLHVQSQQWKHQNNKRNLFKIDNKGTKTTSFIVVIHVPVSLLSTLNIFYTLYWYFHFWLWTNTDWEGEYWRKKAQITLASFHISPLIEFKFNESVYFILQFLDSFQMKTK